MDIIMGRGIILLVIAIFFNASANILMKIGMMRIRNSDTWIVMIKRAVVQPVLIIGIVAFVLALSLYCLVLTKLNLSVAYPIMVSMGLVIVIFASYFFLKETITLVQVMGFLFIIAGVWMVAR
jgi:multidrug transporter EmrE-like cation transporter